MRSHATDMELTSIARLLRGRFALQRGSPPRDQMNLAIPSEEVMMNGAGVLDLDDETVYVSVGFKGALLHSPAPLITTSDESRQRDGY